MYNLNAQTAAAILQDPALVAQVAQKSGFSTVVIEGFLKRLMETPTISKETQEYLWSDARGDSFRSYIAGTETGRIEGEKTGFFKGVAATTVVMAGIALSIYFKIKLSPF